MEIWCKQHANLRFVVCKFTGALWLNWVTWKITLSVLLRCCWIVFAVHLWIWRWRQMALQVVAVDGCIDGVHSGGGGQDLSVPGLFGESSALAFFSFSFSSVCFPTLCVIPPLFFILVWILSLLIYAPLVPSFFSSLPSLPLPLPSSRSLPCPSFPSSLPAPHFHNHHRRHLIHHHLFLHLLLLLLPSFSYSSSSSFSSFARPFFRLVISKKLRAAMQLRIIRCTCKMHVAVYWDTRTHLFTWFGLGIYPYMHEYTELLTALPGHISTAHLLMNM